MRTKHLTSSGNRGRQAGFSLIELMIALILGLLVAAAAGGVFISNKRVYNATETPGGASRRTRALRLN
ncbi:PilW family protein [Arenimonas daejeonensis]|uniref:PilW family protein n=1 Tax=Arenimonas daejeonensis TaxID=370777 RepID=UPI0011BEB406|nr:prepilin-type N-terminal cleavage/methylation domain-containing protein [Arenimonas daejeonensis]